MQNVDKTDMIEFSRIMSELYIRNSFNHAMRYYHSNESALQYINKRKNDYLSYCTRTFKRIAILSGNFDYSMSVMKKVSLEIAKRNNFEIVSTSN